MQNNKPLYIAFIAVFLILFPLARFCGWLDMNTMTLWGRYFCFAIAAIGVDLIWGYTGIMTMCHAFFFCLGAYAMGMFMTLANLPAGQVVPDFMTWNQVETLPFFWVPFKTFPGTLVFGFLVTGIFSFLFSYFIFKRRIKGVFFAIITQALALAMYLLFSRNETMLGGTNGLTNFRYFLGFDLYSNDVKTGLYIFTVCMVCVVFYFSRRLTASKFGKILIGIRDSESRLRFAGYKVVNYQTAVFVIGALIAAFAGMLYLPQTGIITPGRMDVKASIEMLIWVALGGRGQLKGAILGALIVNVLYSLFTSIIPEAWPYILGILYIVTVLYLDEGIIGFIGSIGKKLKIKKIFIS
ncbi:MAG: urea ABC transporter permease subunit UrtC [Tannerellaceae bacterium]|nr:urea ABC transporter permease subunit UrtC [Tannerellaceae bacterium]